jgi:hypothetical protein
MEFTREGVSNAARRTPEVDIRGSRWYLARVTYPVISTDLRLSVTPGMSAIIQSSSRVIGLIITKESVVFEAI